MFYEFFRPPYTAESIKTQYRALAKRHHPDVGGNLAAMQRLNNEYTDAMNWVVRTARPGESEETYAQYARDNEAVRAAMENAVREFDPFPFLTIELRGTWIWIGGVGREATHPIAAEAIRTLTNNGYRFAKSQSMWYLPVEGFTDRPATTPRDRKHKPAWSMEKIRTTFGGGVVRQGNGGAR